MAVCENIPRSEVNLNGISEIQSQDGKTIYAGEFAQYSNLESLINGYGYWVKGDRGVEFESKRALVLPKGFDYKAIDNSGKSVETVYNGYRVKIFSDYKETANDMAHHTGIVVTLDNNITVPTLNIQDTYAGHNIVIAIYDNSNELVGLSDITTVLKDSPITKINVLVESIPQDSNLDNSSGNNEIDLDANFQGLRVFATALRFDDYKLEPITDTDFNALSPNNQRIVANKLLSALFYGIPKTKLDEMIKSGKFISTIKKEINTPNKDVADVEELIKKKHYSYWEVYIEQSLARLFYLKLGREYINRWVAYQLTQSIMFSPAFELRTVGISETSNVYNNLVMYMDDSYSMRFITYLHMISNDNWKRFRSPEDNGREMLEIFTYDFNDSDVPKAAIALKNWKLERKDGELVIGLDQNTQPQKLFGTTVTTGFDFYRELVKSDAFLEGVIKRVVDIYFSNYPEKRKQEIVNLIKSSNPERFQDIFLQIVFSKEFLYNANRVKSLEETVYHMTKKTDFHVSINYFAIMRNALDNMHQSAMRYKLGRKTTVPTDTLSFAYYHDFVRNYAMVNYRGDYLNEWDSGWQESFIDKSIPNTDTLEGFVDYIFLSTISRLPNNEEKSAIVEYCKDNGYDDMSINNDRRSAAIVTMEYISRLTEVYTFKKIEE